MTVNELIKQLQQYDPDRPVLICRTEIPDNGVRTLDDLDDSFNWDGDETVKLAAMTDELAAQGYTAEDTLPDGQPVVILFPGAC